MNPFEIYEPQPPYKGLPWGIRRRGEPDTATPIALFTERWLALDALRVVNEAYAGAPR